VKPHIVERYNRHVGYVNNSNHMANSYSMSQRTFKWTTKLFFHFLDLTVLNSWILLSSCGTKNTHRDFRLLLVRNLIEEAGKSQDRPTPRLAGRTCFGAKNVLRQPNSTAVCVLFAAKETTQCINAPDVMWACAWCLVSRNIAQK